MTESIGHPDRQEFDCAGVLEDVYIFLDNEGDPAQRARMQRHLDECPRCLRDVGIEADLKALLARKCGGDIAPERLRASVRIRLQELIVDD